MTDTTYVPDYPPQVMRERQRFAWWPVRLDDGSILRLRPYLSLERFQPDHTMWRGGRWVVTGRRLH